MNLYCRLTLAQRLFFVALVGGRDRAAPAAGEPPVKYHPESTLILTAE